MTTKKQSKSPVLAAILNFIIPGVGYLYVGVRKKFAWMLVAASIVAFISMFDPNSFMYMGDEGSATSWTLLDSLSLLIVAVAFAYDAHVAAKQAQK